MSLAYLSDYSENFHNLEIARNNHLDVWNDLLSYASNLKGNWLVSQRIFNMYLLPTVEKNPKLFAKWVDDMVKISGLKVKYRSNFVKAIMFLKRYKALKRAGRADLKIALAVLFQAGLNEPLYAKNALYRVENL